MVLTPESTETRSGSMRRLVIQTGLALAALLLALYGLALWRGEERVLKRRLVALTSLIEKTGNEKPIATLNRMRKIGDLFAGEIEFVPGSGLPTTMGRQELLIFVQNIRSSLRELRVRVREQKVLLSADRQSATTHAVFEIRVQSAADRATEVREGIIEWRRVNKDWQIRTVRAADTIRNPAWAE